MVVRYDVQSWIGKPGPEPEGHHYFRVWGRGRAVRLAERIIREYRADRVPDFEVAIPQARDDVLRWYFSRDREAPFGIAYTGPLRGEMDGAASL